MLNRPRVIPCLSIEKRDLVKTIHFKNPRYLGDPMNAVKIFNDKGVDELCLLDIRAGVNKTKPDMPYLRDVASEAFMPLSYGGGITSVDEIKEIFHLGYEKVIIGTGAIGDFKLVEKASRFAGAQSIVVAIDYKTDMFGRKTLYTSSGKKRTGLTPEKAAKMAEDSGAGEILLNSITNDGMMQGYDLKTIRSVADSVKIPVIASGGAGDLEDLRKAIQEGHAHAVAASSLFIYYGSEKAVLIHFPDEDELKAHSIYG